MQKLARNPKWLGGLIGALGVLHTWTRALTFHPHVLPRGFKKVRRFGFLASRNKQLLARLQYMPGTVELEPQDEAETEGKIPCRPVCGKPMILIDIVPPGGFDAQPEIFLTTQRQARAP